jgi:hypothetical protein
MATAKFLGISKLKKLENRVKEMPDVMNYLNADITERVAKKIESSAKRRLIDRTSSKRTRTLEETIKAIPIKRRGNSTIWQVSAGTPGKRGERPKGDKDPGAYYAYYVEVGTHGEPDKEGNQRGLGHYIYRPWIWNRTPVSGDVDSGLGEGESPVVWVKARPAAWYMRHGIKMGAKLLKTELFKAKTRIDRGGSP